MTANKNYTTECLTQTQKNGEKKWKILRQITIIKIIKKWI